MSSKSRNKSIVAMKGRPFTRKTKFAKHSAAYLKSPIFSLIPLLDILTPDYFESYPSSSTLTTQSPQPEKKSSDSKNNWIIAMKGHPFTRKTKLATHIAASLKCPVLSVDHLLDFLTPDYFQRCPSSNTLTTLLSPQPQDLAFKIICQIAKAHLSAGIFKKIVIDSPLSSRSHLDQLMELASSLEQTRLVIVECKADNLYAWQTKFEEYLDGNPAENRDKWYKAKNWEDVEKAIRDGYDERWENCYKISTLVLDPFSDYQDYTDKYPRSPLIDAVEYMMKRKEGDGPNLVVYRQWRQCQYLPSTCTRDNEVDVCDGQGKKTSSCRAGSGHYITNYAEQGLGYEAKCMACEKKLVISEAAYTCKYCSLVLHKECAELLDHNNKPPGGVSSGYLPIMLQHWTDPLSPEHFLCSSCVGGYNPDSYHCNDCFFISHLKNRLMPTVICHDCDEHFLSVVFSHLNWQGQFSQCKACGGNVELVWYSCKTCGVAYHYRCLTESAVRVDHEHGGHHHHMLLRYSSEEADDYQCDVCFERGDPERRDPSRWFYSCHECVYVAHLECVQDGRTGGEEYCSNEEEFNPWRPQLFPQEDTWQMDPED